MNDEKIKEYTLKISQANRSELVVLMYEIVIILLQEASDKFNDDKTAAVKALKKAQGFINELRGSLDFKYDISVRLYCIYRHVGKQIGRSIAAMNSVNIDECIDIFEGLHEAYMKVSDADDSPALMKQTQEVYAGFTYGRGSLDEVTLEKNNNRGFLA